MLARKPKIRETVASRILSRAREYGVANEKGPVFDRIFNREETDDDIALSRNAVGQSKRNIQYPNGMTPDGYSSFSPTLGVNSNQVDPKRVFDQTAENQVHLFWKKNREHILRYYRVAGRAEVSEALDNICDECIYKDDLGKICSLKIDEDADIGSQVKEKLHKIFRRDVLKKAINFDKEGWNIMRTLLIEGRLFFEVVYDEEKNEIRGINLLPSHNMIIIIQDGLIIGYRQMLEGNIPTSIEGGTGGGYKNYVDFSPNQILYVDLGMYGPGGLNDPRSPLQYAVKSFNQLNAVEDAITMYRIQWGSEKLVFKIDTGSMPKPKAEKHMKDQAKLLSRRVDYNTATGEVTNFGRVIGLGEHFFISTSNFTAGSSIDRLPSGDNINKIEDLKYFKRNLVNSMKVPPGRITALAGDGENYTTGKIGDVTQSEVAFARMVQRYQQPLTSLLTRLFVMVLNTKSDISQDIKLEDNFGIDFNKANEFQNYIDAEILNTNLGTFDGLMKHTKSEDNPIGILSKKYALQKGLKLTDEEISLNAEWLKTEEDEGEKNK